MLIDAAQNMGLKIEETLRNTELRLSQKNNSHSIYKADNLLYAQKYFALVF